MTKTLNSRAAAAKLSWQIIDQGQSLDACLTNFFTNSEAEYSSQDRGFIQELVYGICRWYGELDSVASQLLRTPIRKKNRAVHFVLLVGLYQLRHLATPEHAAVAETVSACKQLNKQWAKNVINGCLRNYLRQLPEPTADANQLSHSEWIVNSINKAWPEHASTILAANNQRPPMCLRVNNRQHTRDQYLELLAAADISATSDEYTPNGIVLESPCAVTLLPGFEDGACSVQDTAAQISADLLEAQPGMAVLDACAAPGGKTAHLLERCDNQLDMHALDISARRCEQLKATLARLKLDAKVYTADASQEPGWAPPNLGYDRILIDAPCSGLGVIRRHPDIKHHRRPSDIEQLEEIQSALLRQLWPLLKSGGTLLYMTCSVLPRENEQQVKRFVATTNDAMLAPITHPNALTLNYGVQTLPGVHGMDGFYYCLLQKQ